ncbi:MAG: alpha/beta fold hydrolase [Mycobacteriaceae bacterium]
MSVREDRQLNLVPDREPPIKFLELHGYRRAYRMAGKGPAILLIHGIGDNSSTWNDIFQYLAQRFTVIAPDLLGHGQSDKPRADYSVPAYANGIRDLLSVLGIERVTVVGHSLGGGVAMQFSYQFPHMVDRLVVVGTGGVTKDVNPLLRLASVPVINEGMKILRIPGAVDIIKFLGSTIEKISDAPIFRDTPDVVRVLSALPDPTASEAFIRTLRAVVDWRGQVVTMLDRCYLTEFIPVQIFWGDEDSVIPVSHAYLAHAAMPGSRLEIFEKSGHFPFHDDPARFLRVLEDFIASTEPAHIDMQQWSNRLRSGLNQQDITGTTQTKIAVFEAMGTDERSAT